MSSHQKTVYITLGVLVCAIWATIAVTMTDTSPYQAGAFGIATIAGTAAALIKTYRAINSTNSAAEPAADAKTGTPHVALAAGTRAELDANGGYADVIEGTASADRQAAAAQLIHNGNADALVEHPRLLAWYFDRAGTAATVAMTRSDSFAQARWNRLLTAAHDTLQSA